MGYVGGGICAKRDAAELSAPRELRQSMLMTLEWARFLRIRSIG